MNIETSILLKSAMHSNPHLGIDALRELDHPWVNHLIANQRTQQDDVHKAAYVGLTEHFVVDWVDWKESDAPQDWIADIHKLLQWNVAVDSDPRVGGTPKRTQQDQDNALFCMALRERYVVEDVELCEFVTPWEAPNGGPEIIPMVNGLPQLTDEIRNALKKALGEQE